MAIDSGAAAQYPVPYAVAIDGACRALTALGMGVRGVDTARGVISASTSVSLMSWGESLTVVVSALGPDWSQVAMHSSLKFGLIDWGKNGSNVNRFHQTLAATLATPGAPVVAPGVVAPAVAAPVALAAAPAAGAWHPDPSGRHQLRWWDGQQWTASVSDGGVTATDPL